MAPRILMSCVAEDREPYYTRVAMLADSARAFGGALGERPLLASFVGGIDPRERQKLEAAGVEVRVVDPHPEGGLSNKLRAFEVPAREDFDVLLYVDCDVAVADDPAPLLRDDAIGVVTADVCLFDEREWESLLERFAKVPLERSVRTGRTGTLNYPYFNSGVIAVPRELCEPLLAAWNGTIEQLREHWERDPPKQYRRYYGEQLSLALALWSGLPWYELDHGVNFPTHLKLHPSVADTVSRPMLLHYQRHVDGGCFLMRPKEIRAERAAERINSHFAETSGRRWRGFRDPGLSRRLVGKTRYRMQMLRDAVS